MLGNHRRIVKGRCEKVRLELTALTNSERMCHTFCISEDASLGQVVGVVARRTSDPLLGPRDYERIRLITLQNRRDQSMAAIDHPLKIRERVVSNSSRPSLDAPTKSLNPALFMRH